MTNSFTRASVPSSWKPKGKIQDQRGGRLRVRTLESPHPRATQLCSGADSGRSCEMAEQQLLNHKQEEETKGEAGEQRDPQPGGASVSVPSALTGAGSLRRASASLRERHGACLATLPGHPARPPCPEPLPLNKGRRREE